jgi:hypothetical protein
LNNIYVKTLQLDPPPKEYEYYHGDCFNMERIRELRYTNIITQLSAKDESNTVSEVLNHLTYKPELLYFGKKELLKILGDEPFRIKHIISLETPSLDILEEVKTASLSIIQLQQESNKKRCKDYVDYIVLAFF